MGPLDLPRAARPGPGEPVGFGLGCGDARELARRRPDDRAGGERAVEERQAGEGARNAEALLGLPAIEAEEAFGVLAEAGEPGPRMRAEALRGEEPAAELALVDGAVPAERDEALVDVLPVGDAGGVPLADEQERSAARDSVGEGGAHAP